MKGWKDRKVLVTGCNGFVGGWLVKALVDLGAEVTGLIRDIVPDSALNLLGYKDRINVVHGDVEDYDLVRRALNEHDIEVCFHLAAQSQVGVANRSPVSTFKTNIMGTLSVLEASRKLGTLEAIVVASSDKAYGVHKTLPYEENFALRGTHPYDASKACADILSQAYFNTYNLPVAVGRCGNIFGPCDPNMKRIVPDTMRALSVCKAPIIRSDGKYIRDYIFVEDAVSAYLSLGEALLDKKKGALGEAFNFGTGRPVSVLELVNMMIKASGKKVKPRILNTATGEIREQYLSSRKARSVLGWKPRHTLESAVKATCKWYGKHLKGKA